LSRPNPHLASLPAILWLLSLPLGFHALAQETEPPPPLLSPADSTQSVDSLRTNTIFGYRHLQSGANVNPALQSASYVWSDAKYAGDLLSTLPSTFLRELGEPGLPHQLSFSGIDSRGTIALFDGRPLNDPVTGSFDIFQVPLEYAERLERISGSRAQFLSRNAVGGALNVVSHQYSTIRPITKIRFVQGPFEHLLTDGLFTQNVVQDANLTVGFQRQAADGRYKNAQYDSWLLRTRLRYDVTDRINMIASFTFSDSRNGLNGGVFADSTRSVYEEASATVVNTNAHQRVTRADYALSLVARLFKNPSSITSLDIVSSESDREFDNSLALPSSILGDFSWKSLGIQGKQILLAEMFHGNIMVHYDRTTASAENFFADDSKDYWSVAATVGIPVTSLFTSTISTQAEQERNQTVFNYGLDLEFNAHEGVLIAGGISRGSRFPTFLEHHWNASLGLVSLSDLIERHDLLSIEGHLRLSDHFTASLFSSYRSVTNAQMIAAVPAQRLQIPVLRVLSELTVFDASAAVSVQMGRWTGRGSATFTQIRGSGSVLKIYPSFSGGSEIIYQDSFFKGHLHTRFGLRLRITGSHDGMEFFPSLLLFGSRTGRDVPFSSPLDLFGAFRVGDIYFSLTMENVLNEQYYMVPTYPMLGRSFRFGINWKFLD